MKKRILFIMLTLISVVGISSCASSSFSDLQDDDGYEGLNLKSKLKRDEMIAAGATWLAAQQRPNGLWGEMQADLGLTCLAMRTLLRVDPVKYKGTCYKASNWQYLGRTSGYKKNANVGKTSPKDIYIFPLSIQFRDILKRKPKPASSKRVGRNLTALEKRYV